MRINEVLPDRIEVAQWRNLAERLVTALELHYGADPVEQRLISEARQKLGTTVQRCPDYYSEGGCG